MLVTANIYYIDISRKKLLFMPSVKRIKGNRLHFTLYWTFII